MLHKIPHLKDPYSGKYVAGGKFILLSVSIYFGESVLINSPKNFRLPLISELTTLVKAYFRNESLPNVLT